MVMLGELSGGLVVFGVEDATGDVDEGRSLAVGSGEGGEVSALGTKPRDEKRDIGDAGEHVGVGIGESYH